MWLVMTSTLHRKRVRHAPATRTRFPVNPTVRFSRAVHDGLMAFSVLVVDDDDRFRGLATRILVDCGYHPVNQAGSVADAVRQVTLLQPELALVDIGLPDGDGLELSKKLAAAVPSVRIVLVSADSDATTQARAREAGAVGFIAKSDLSCAVLDSLLQSP